MKAKTDFYLRSNAGDKPQPIVLDVFLSERKGDASGKLKTTTQKIKIATNASIVPKHWDKKKKVPKPSVIGREEVLAEMDRVEGKVTYALQNLPEGWTPD